MATIEFKAKAEISPEQMNDLMVAALEGGISYWCRRAVMQNVPEDQKENVKFASDAIGYGGEVVLYDDESSDKWVLTQEAFLKGIKMLLERGDFVSFDELFENHDAETADTIVQLALFDEIVFG